MPEAVVVATARSPIGRAFKGSLTSIRPDDLTAQLVAAALAKVPQVDPAQISDLILGCGLPGGEQGYNMARVVAVMLGYDSLPGTTITRYCSSSLQSTRMAFHAIKAGEGDIYISAGVETVSRFGKGSSDGLPDTKTPVFADAEARAGEMGKGGFTWADPREDGKIPDIYIAMGQTAENVAQQRGITRAAQDEFGVRSQNLAEKALANGFWQRDITPVTLPDGSVVSADDGPRPGTSLEKVSQLQPVFRPDGTVTAGNSCPLNDGAAAAIIMSAERAQELGLKPRARIITAATWGNEPEYMGVAPIGAIKKALQRAGMTIDDVDIVELNEAFAAQVLPIAQEVGFGLDILNPHGGAIALGHPFGMTGVRIMTTLLNDLDTLDGTIGLETMCVAQGQGEAMIIERLK